MQVSATGASQSIFTVKRSLIQGIELQADARPLPGLDFSLGGGFQDGKIKEFGNSLAGGSRKDDRSTNKRKARAA